MNGKPFPLPDNPYVLVAGIFVFVSGVAVLVFLLQRLSGKKLRKKLPVHRCPFCHQAFGVNVKAAVKDIGLFQKYSAYSTPNWVWEVTCPHCGKTAQFTEHGEPYHGSR